MKGDNRYKFSRKIFKEASSRCICLLLKSLPSFDEAFVSEDEYYRRSLEFNCSGTLSISLWVVVWLLMQFYIANKGTLGAAGLERK